MVHGPQKTGPRWSGSVPSISGAKNRTELDLRTLLPTTSLRTLLPTTSAHTNDDDDVAMDETLTTQVVVTAHFNPVNVQEGNVAIAYVDDDLNIVVSWLPDPYKDRSRPVANRLRPGLVKTSLVTAKDRKRPVCCSSVWFFELSRIGRTGYGYGLRHWAPKDRTGPDFQTLPLPSQTIIMPNNPSILSYPDTISAGHSVDTLWNHNNRN
ncbi:uncharacterized protein LACBIDRAFT_329920 [Laccaria bicolor S238N-H82]|uniref:Predicted protein n=1 Tax=Laccaria bicolor (strain S238N-H82 / ATCC MYA-4686) TaxID=486041 RepID=B0DJM1_LACBS|nr:uncharacterized protein LACBIDRAFT_329920 [Laccaria bicolor S238N-H82]EDR05143.1 predicted protein [Laccaria bicolor S238N-H82]|eukprot:XP_001884108.1 predicted protein [Laccaria bicolor S238N-H82]